MGSQVEEKQGEPVLLNLLMGLFSYGRCWPSPDKPLVVVISPASPFFTLQTRYRRYHVMNNEYDYNVKI